MLKLAVMSLLALIVAAAPVQAQTATFPPQVPLCMIGDSITWAPPAGDFWRAYLLEEIPPLAFVGTHSALLGYSHAGEGGNGTLAVLQRLPEIPDCPYYSLLIGTNDPDGKTPAEQQVVAQARADRIIQIVRGLLTKPSVKKVFLGSILPCQTDNPFRDQTNSVVNTLLRPQISPLFPDGKVVWVEYEKPIRSIRNWEPLILLHPTKSGYRLIATILAQTIRDELKLGDNISAPQPVAGAGVRVENLWQGDQTVRPIIAGWYTVSFDVKAAEAGATIKLTGEGKDPNLTLVQTFQVPATAVGKRLTWEILTGFEGYGYTRGVIKMTTDKCTVDHVLFEKKRPSGVASVYGVGSYLDATSPISLGELVEKNATSVPADDQKPAGLVKNGDAENGTLENWKGFDKAVAEGVHAGKFCFERKGDAIVQSVEMVPINPDKIYTLTGWFRSAGKEPSTVYFGYTPFDAQKQWIEPQFVNPIAGTETTLFADTKRSDTTVKIADGGKWQVTPWAYIAFDVDASGNYVDLPNRRLSNMGVLKVENKGQYWEVQLKEACGQEYAAGTKIRLHMAGAVHIYNVLSGNGVNTNWASASATIKGVVKSGIPMDHFWPGTKYVQILILANYAQKDTADLLVDDIALTESDK